MALITVHENDPHPGYYRMRAKRGGPWAPVAIWTDGETMRALKGSSPVHPCDVWTWCCRHPIPYETYVAVAERGEPWPDDLPGLGHNRISDDPLEAIMAEVAALREAAEGWLAAIGAVGTQVQADKAANFAGRFAALEKQAEETRTAQKRPALEQGRSIDASWKPVVASAQQAKSWMKKALEPFLLAELAKSAALNGGEVETPKAGSAGRRIGLKRVRSLEVTDAALLHDAYRGDARLWRSPELGALVAGLALQDLEAGRTVSGARLVVSHVAV